MSEYTGQIIRGVLVLALILSGTGYVVYRSLRKADDPARAIFKWLITAGVFAFAWKMAIPELLHQDLSALVGLLMMLICALMMIVVWRHEVAGLLANPIASLYDGGSEPPVPRPAYSVAQARQKQGRYLEAIAEVRKQLERFPADVEGQLLLAQIQAEDLKDMAAAELTIQRFCEQPDHAPANVVFALYSMADWHLKIDKDRDAAQRDLEKIVERFPESEFALGASHRIAHLGTTEMLLKPEERQEFLLKAGQRNIGLLPSSAHLRPQEADPEKLAAEYVRHLEQHPLDSEAREKLAVIYVDHYKRLDLATDQLEQLIEQEHQPNRLVARWLNLLADLQIRSGASYETVRETLQRIIDRDPTMAAAEMARHRQSLVKLELKGQEKSQAVKLGTYEKNIGLKQARRLGE